LNNLDNILKQQMQNFAPDAPNIWEGIAQGVQANAAAQSAVVSKVVLSKIALVVIKVVAILAIPASIATYFYAKNTKNKEVIFSKLATNEAAVIATPFSNNKAEVLAVNPKEPKSFEQNVVKNKVNLKDIPKAIAAINSKNKDYQLIIENHIEPLDNKITEKSIYELNQINTQPLIVQAKNELVEKIESIENNEFNLEATEQITNSSHVKIPNVFTPNNDGSNDEYVVQIEGEKLFVLKIYNFNNELVFESIDKNYTWDGVSQKTGQACNSGVYYVVLNYKFNYSDKLQTKMTKLKLIR
jgi:gliding motility-associated-like protein